MITPIAIEHLPNRYGTSDVSGTGCKPKSGAHTTEYRGLRVTSLIAEQHRKTCGYWYLVTAMNRSHTAFAKRDHLLQWLQDRGLWLTGELAPSGEFSVVTVDGVYRRTSHVSYDEFYSLDGRRVRVLDNADYTLGIIVDDADGVANVHLLNCNLRDRLVFDYQASRILCG